jgi:SAM-dependent methyltransferase
VSPPSPLTRREGRERFGDDPDNYDRARPPYPARVYEILVERCGLGERTRVFEVGAGTGLATRGLVALGAGPVVAVEPDPRLAAHLSASIAAPGTPVTVRNASFENVRLRAASFDLGIAATSFHWVDQRRGLAKAFRLLCPGGWWAMWWNIYGDPLGYDPFHEATGRMMDERTAPLGGRPVFALEVDTRQAELAAAGFESTQHDLIRWSHRFTPETTRALYATFSNVTRLPKPDRDSLLDEIERVAREDFGGVVHRPMLTVIYTARKPRGDFGAGMPNS